MHFRFTKNLGNFNNRVGVFRDQSGTALLVALLVMGVFISISLALSTLVFRETRVTKNLVDSGKAYYAAESAVEMALYGLNNHLPGWEPEVSEKSGFKSVKIGDDLSSVAEFKVNNRCRAYPCFDDGFDLSSLPDDQLKAYYDVLDLNESITIPLFVVREGENGMEEVPVKDFTVEFFAPFDPVNDLNVDNTFNLQGWDILRWKILGIRNGGLGETETISDFTALSFLNNRSDPTEKFASNSQNPSWFGSIRCGAVSASERYTDLINCNDYLPSETFQLQEDNQISAVYGGICFNTQAREYYDYGSDRRVDSEDVRECYEIKDFLRSHKLNYLTLTNLMNPAVLNSGTRDERMALSKLYFRVELFGDIEDPGNNMTVREFADIVAHGYSGKSRQSIDVRLKRGSFVPVFHFALYSTYETDESRDEGVYAD